MPAKKASPTKVAAKKAAAKKASSTKASASKAPPKSVALASADLPAKSPLPDDYKVRIRMYRQGLGDCFLLTFPKTGGGEVHMMIDCGVVLGTPEPAGKMAQVAQSLRAETRDGARRGSRKLISW